jgi:hypothetical protein
MARVTVTSALVLHAAGNRVLVTARMSQAKLTGAEGSTMTKSGLLPSP